MEHEKDPVPRKEWKPPSLMSIAEDLSGSRSWQTPIADEPTLEPAGARGLLLFSTAEGASLGSPIVGGISLASLSAGEPFLGPPVAEGVCLDSLIAKHQKYTDAWRTSSAYSACRELLINTVLMRKNIRITQCMCLCLGSLSTQQTVGRGKKKYSHSMSQLVAFEGWVESLKTKHDITKIFFQDPAFNALDKELLSSRGYTVLDTPQSDDYMSETTFLFTHKGDWNIILATLGAAFPALYIGHNLTPQMHMLLPPGARHGNDLVRHALPAAAPDERDFLRRYLSQRVTSYLPGSGLADWLDELPLGHPPTMLYAPDHKEGIPPVEFACGDEELFTYEQAKVEWKKRGLDIP